MRTLFILPLQIPNQLIPLHKVLQPLLQLQLNRRNPPRLFIQFDAQRLLNHNLGGNFVGFFPEARHERLFFAVALVGGGFEEVELLEERGVCLFEAGDGAKGFVAVVVRFFEG